MQRWYENDCCKIKSLVIRTKTQMVLDIYRTMNTKVAKGSNGTQMLYHIHNIHFHNTNDVRQALHEDLRDIQRVMHIGERSTVEIIKQKAIT